MTEPSNLEKLEKRLGDLERQHEKTRGLLIDALSYTMAVIACIWFEPEGWVTTIIVGGGAFIIASRFHRWTLRDQPDRVARFINQLFDRSSRNADGRRNPPVQDEGKAADHGSADPPGWLRAATQKRGARLSGFGTGPAS